MESGESVAAENCIAKSERREVLLLVRHNLAQFTVCAAACRSLSHAGSLQVACKLQGGPFRSGPQSSDFSEKKPAVSLTAK